jgi:hypothetical protein
MRMWHFSVFGHGGLQSGSSRDRYCRPGSPQWRCECACAGSIPTTIMEHGPFSHRWGRDPRRTIRLQVPCPSFWSCISSVTPRTQTGWRDTPRSGQPSTSATASSGVKPSGLLRHATGKQIRSRTAGRHISRQAQPAKCDGHRIPHTGQPTEESEPADPWSGRQSTAGNTLSETVPGRCRRQPLFDSD